MAYTSNPFAPKARKQATNLVKRGFSKAQVARIYGVHRATIGKWMKKATKHSTEHIQTTSSAAHNHHNQLPQETVNKVIALRKQTKRCVVIIHHQLALEGVSISLSSVKRILKRYKLLRPMKRHIRDDTRFPRPSASKPGDLVQADTIHYVYADYSRAYIYAVIDLYSRMAYAEFQPKISSSVSLSVLSRAQKYFPFSIDTLQTDNGQEFGQKFFYNLKSHHIRLRHSRVRRPNDNAHIERFNRTLQEECFDGFHPNPTTANRRLKAFIAYYNFRRLHLGINCLTPSQMLPR